jgi:Domain of unknown function (DUF3805)
MKFLNKLFNKLEETKTKQIISDHKYSIDIPMNWSEYELEEDEKGTNAFFDTTKWTGNLRVTLMGCQAQVIEDILNKLPQDKNKQYIDWGNICGIYHFEKTENKEVHYWNLVENNNLFVCSFFIGHINDKLEIESELGKVSDMLKSVKTL